MIIFVEQISKQSFGDRLDGFFICKLFSPCSVFPQLTDVLNAGIGSLSKESVFFLSMIACAMPIREIVNRYSLLDQDWKYVN